ncbi:unnamed protein product [Lathyrus sativus]|nr:unnamed protein product [Lathyrus sativus]
MSSKKLTNHEHITLVEKIGGRLNHWSSHLLSYAGRVKLIKSVIFGISNYWLHYIRLPKGVAQRLKAMCRSFLWTGKSEISRKSPVAWKIVCFPKKQGGLNVMVVSE